MKKGFRYESLKRPTVFPIEGKKVFSKRPGGLVREEVLSELRQEQKGLLIKVQAFFS